MKPERYIVSVAQETGGHKRYRVMCSTEDDAIQIAFALDGGWGKDRNATGMISLAKAYCRVEPKQ